MKQPQNLMKMKRSLGRPECSIGSMVTGDRQCNTGSKYISQLGKNLYELSICSYVTSATWLNKMSLVVSCIHNSLASIHRPNAFVGTVGYSTIYQKTWGVLPTHVLSNRYIDLGPVCGLCSGLWAGSSPSWLWTVLDDHPWMQEPMWKSRFSVKKL